VLCVDEKSQMQALDRTAPILPLRPGLPERQTHDYKRYGTTTLFAAFNILNGKVIGSCLPRHRARVREVSQPSGEASPSRPGRAHHSGQLQHAQERHRKTVAQIPKAPPLLFPLHPHQQFLAQSGGTLLRLDHGTHDPPRHFRSVEELERAIYAWLANWNNKPHPLFGRPLRMSSSTRCAVAKN